MLNKIYKHSSIISIIVIVLLLFNWTAPVFSLPLVSLGGSELAASQEPWYEPFVTGFAIGAIVFLVALLVRIFFNLGKSIVSLAQPRFLRYETEGEFLRYEEERKITDSSFTLSIQKKATEQGKHVFSIHLDKIEEITVYRKEIYLNQRFKVYSDAKKQLVEEQEVVENIEPISTKKEVSAVSGVQVEVLTDMNLLKPGIVPKTDENGNTQIPIYSAKPFLEIEGTRNKNYGLTLNTQFLSQERFKDYQKISVTFRYKDARITEEINCYSLENSVKDFIDSAINTNIKLVRFIVEDTDSHISISNPNIKIQGTPPTEEELLAPYFTEEYNAYATKFVKSYLRGSHEMTSYGTAMLYYPFSYVVEVVHPKYHFWEKKIYIDGSKDEYIIRMSELGTKIRTELVWLLDKLTV